MHIMLWFDCRGRLVLKMDMSISKLFVHRLCPIRTIVLKCHLLCKETLIYLFSKVAPEENNIESL